VRALLELVVLGVLLARLPRFTRAVTSIDVVFACAAVLGFVQLWFGVKLGQIALLMALAMMAVMDGRGRWAPALGLAALTMKPQLALLPLLSLIARRRWDVLGRGALVVGAWAVVTTAVLGPRVWLEFAALTTGTGLAARPFFFPEIMHNLRGLLASALGPRAPRSRRCRCSACWPPVRGVLRQKGESATRSALVITLTAFTSPHLYRHDDVLYLLAALLWASEDGAGWVLAASMPLAWAAGMISGALDSSFQRALVLVQLVLLAITVARKAPWFARRGPPGVAELGRLRRRIAAKRIARRRGKSALIPASLEPKCSPPAGRSSGILESVFAAIVVSLARRVRDPQVARILRGNFC
jgi:hypothetical protein